jgi:hypothetical protein
MKTNKRSGPGRRQPMRESGRQRTRLDVREVVQKIERPVIPPPKDLIEARKSISDVVRGAALGIVGALIEKAEGGEVAPAKYLFEMVGLYPVTEETAPKPEDSLAYTLLQRMGLPPLEEECAGAAPAGNQFAPERER